MKKLLFVFIFVTTICNAQDTIYYNDKNEKTNIKSLAVKYEVLDKNTITYYKDGVLKMKTFYKTKRHKKRVKHIAYYKNGQQSFVTNYKKNKRHGDSFRYYENGVKKRHEIFNNGKMVSGVCYNELEEKIDYFPFESPPKFPGGPKALQKYVSLYMSSYERTGNPEYIIVQFIINKKGKTEKVSFKKRSADPILNAKVVNMILNMPTWTPATIDKKPVSVPRAIPLRI